VVLQSALAFSFLSAHRSSTTRLASRRVLGATHDFELAAIPET
jgi:hypothetical protein